MNAQLPQDVRGHLERHDLPPPPTLESFDFRTEYDLIDDLGYDPNTDALHEVINRNLADGVRITIPEGEYPLTGRITARGLSNVALVGAGDGATRFVLRSGITSSIVQFLESRNCAFVGIDLDQSARNCSAQTWFRAHDGLIVRDVTFHGFSSPDDSGKKIVALVLDGSGSGLIDDVTMTDGTEVGREGVSHNGTHKHRYDGGIWSGPPHEGTLHVVDCEVANWSDNGLYASRTNGGVVVSGGYYANSSISQVRLSHEESFVGGGVVIEIDPSRMTDRQNPAGLANPRGIWLEPGSLDNDGTTVGDVHLRVAEDAPRISGAIMLGHAMGRVDVVGPVDVEIEGDDTPAIYAREPSRSGSARAHTMTIEDLTVVSTGGGGPLVDIESRPHSSIRNACLHQTGAGRDGVRFRGNTTGCRVDASTVNVPGEPVRGGATSDLSTSDSCRLRDPTADDAVETEGWIEERDRDEELALAKACRTAVAALRDLQRIVHRS
jgi:hypothetical protein